MTTLTVPSSAGTPEPDLQGFPLLREWLHSYSARIPGVHWPDPVSPPSRKKKYAMRRQLDRLLNLGGGLMWLRETLPGVCDLTPRTEVCALARAMALAIVGARPAIVVVHRAPENGSYHIHIAVPCRDDGEPECCEYAERAGEADRDFDNLARYMVESHDGRAKNTMNATTHRRTVPPSMEALQHAAELYLTHAAIYRRNRRYGGGPKIHPRMRFYLNWSGFPL